MTQVDGADVLETVLESIEAANNEDFATDEDLEEAFSVTPDDQ